MTRTQRMTERMLDFIRRGGLVLRRDLREEMNVSAHALDECLAESIATGMVVLERLEDAISSRHCLHYRWVGKGPAPKNRPCLGGCGRQIRRDGRVFMCHQCRSAAASASPYAL